MFKNLFNVGCASRSASPELLVHEASQSGLAPKLQRGASRFERKISIALGALCAAWGLLMVVAWHSHHSALNLIAQLGPIMRFNTAVLFIILGISIVAYSLRAKRIVWVGATLAIAVGALTLLQVPLHVDFGIDELLFRNPYTTGELAGSRMSLNSATCAVLVGASLLMLLQARGQGRRLLVAGLLASAAAAVCLVAIVGHFTGLIAARGWFGSGGMSIPTATGYLLMSVWICCLTARHEKRTAKGRIHWLPLTVGNAAVVATLALWHGLEYQDNQNVKLHVQRQFETLCVELSYALKHYDGVLQRMAARWDAAGQTPEPIWRADVNNYLQALRGFETIAWIDADAKPQRVVNSPEFDFDAGVPIPAALLKTLADARDRAASTSIAPTPAKGDPDIWICKPVSNDGQPDGWMIAVFNLRRLMRDALKHTRVDGQVLEIQGGDTTLYQNRSDGAAADSALRQTAQLPFGNLSLTIVDTPTRAWTQSQRSWLPAMTMLAGLAMSVLLFSTLHLAASARENYAQAIATQRRLRKAMVLQQAILDNAQRSIVSVSPDGVIQVFNRAAQRMLGYTEEEMVGKQTPAVFHDLEEMTQRGIELSLELGRPIDAGIDVFTAKALIDGSEEGEWTYVRKDGSRFPVLLSVSPIRDNQGEVFGFLGIANDITERQRIDRELQQAKLAAESASRAKSEFLANMSHEIRTPMNGIIGMTELVLTTELTRDQRESLEIIQDSADALLTIVNDILDFSKIEAGKLELSAGNFDLAEKVGNAMRTLAGRAAQKGLELICSIHSSVPRIVSGDADRLRQVIVNLVGNAIKFTEQGEIVLHVERCIAEDDATGSGHCQLQFSVSDTGIGIAADKQEAIFAAFAQADSSTTRQFGGTGLGLTISSRLVEMMGGRIWVESEPGQGSTFYFTADFVRVSDEDAASIPFELKSLAGLPVLIVDDIAANRRILSEMVARAGMQPLAVSSVGEALAATFDSASRGKPFAVIITDYLMPGLDGLELARVVRGTGLVAATPIVMLSSAATAECIERGKELAIHSCLAKPIKQVDLLEALQAAIEASGPAQSAVRTVSLAASETEPSTATTDEHVSRRPLRILLAEDNPINQRVSTRMLERDGHQVTIAQNGRQAVELVRQQAFDLVLMDVQMPEMDGFQATAAIRQAEAGDQHLSIIAMTAHALPGDRERCLAAGMDSYITKPVRSADLRQELDSLSLARESQAACNPQAAVCDWPAALAAVDGSFDFLIELVGMFLEDVPPQLDDLRRAVATGDRDQTARLAHRLRGSCQPFCAVAVTEAAQVLESQAHSAAADDQLQISLDAFDQSLTALLAQLTSISNTEPTLSTAVQP